MPTPFTHLAKAHQLRQSMVLPDAVQSMLVAHWGAFLLGSIAPDAHHEAMSSDTTRFTTHFFNYGAEVNPLAEAVMLQTHPQLHFEHLGISEQAAFVAGYLGHLAMDEIWAVEVVHQFVSARWHTPQKRHFAFTSLIAQMDARDYDLLPDDQYVELAAVVPHQWLPFLPDSALIRWRDRIVKQIAPQGQPETLSILARTVYSGYEDLVDMLNSPTRLQHDLWDFFPQEDIARKEAAAVRHMQQVIVDYLQIPGSN